MGVQKSRHEITFYLNLKRNVKNVFTNTGEKRSNLDALSEKDLDAFNELETYAVIRTCSPILVAQFTSNVRPSIRPFSA